MWSDERIDEGESVILNIMGNDMIAKIIYCKSVGSRLVGRPRKK